ncbi:MAG: hypothetical protein ROO71_04310 [Balneola sp.]
MSVSGGFRAGMNLPKELTGEYSVGLKERITHLKPAEPSGSAIWK